MPVSPMSPHPAWLPPAALAGIAGRGFAVIGTGTCLETVRAELTATGAPERPVDAADLIVAVRGAADLPDLPEPPAGGHLIHTAGAVRVVVGWDDAAALRGLFDLARRDAGGTRFAGRVATAPVQPLRMLDHWDNLVVHPVMGQVERGYAGGSIFYDDGRVRADLSRVRSYARLLAAVGIDAVAINNVNVHPAEAHLLTDGLDDVAQIAAEFRDYGVSVYLSVSFDSPVRLGGLESCDPLDADVAAWWARTADAVYAAIPDFGGFVVKADSEGQPGPFAYGRTHADGANVLGAALAPHGGTVCWRAFVYNSHQDWRDRRTDRARAAYDHFAGLDGSFAPNVVLQVKHGPMDFQAREPVSPLLSALPRTRLAVEFQVTQEYTGQQRHVCYLGEEWSELLTFPLLDGATVADLAARDGGVVAVSNVGTDPFWTGHPLAQANLYAFGRLAWDPSLDPGAILDEWIGLTFAGATPAASARIRSALRTMLDGSWQRYEAYTAPLGVGFMVTPGTHGGPSVDGYEYSPWGTYHFADRDGIGVDRTRATGTGYTGQYPAPWNAVYEDPATCPDELLLFFHHVGYDHVLHSGKTVIQHIYDSRADAVESLADVEAAWESLSDLVGTAIDPDYDARMWQRLAEQRASAVEWRDQIRSYFSRKSGVPDASRRTIY